jgi:hypothetical protein
MDHDGPMSWDPGHADHADDGDYGREPDGELPLDHSDVGSSAPFDDPGSEDADTEHADDAQPADADGHGDGLGLEYADLSGESDGGDGDGGDGDQVAFEDTGHDAHDAVDAHDEPDDVSYAEPVGGTHPDLDPVGDHPSWSDDPFPPQLELGEQPEPVDGFPWSDAAVLGDEHDTGATADQTAGYQPAFDQPPAGDLVAYDAHDVPPGEDPWHALAGSDDPATSSLARFWGPA